MLRAIGEHFSSGGNIKGFLEATPETRLPAGLEHRRAGALRKAGDRRQPRLLLRRRVRAFARLRLPHRLRNLLLRAAGAAARPNSRLRRLGAAAEDHRHHPHQGHRDALAPHSGQAGLRMGHRDRVRAGRQAGSGDRRAGRRVARVLAARPAHGEEAAERHRRRDAVARRSSSKVTATAGCGSPTTSARAWRRFTPSGRPGSRERKASSFNSAGSRVQIPEKGQPCRYNRLTVSRCSRSPRLFRSSAAAWPVRRAIRRDRSRSSFRLPAAAPATW